MKLGHIALFVALAIAASASCRAYDAFVVTMVGASRTSPVLAYSNEQGLATATEFAKKYRNEESVDSYLVDQCVVDRVYRLVGSSGRDDKDPSTAFFILDFVVRGKVRETKSITCSREVLNKVSEIVPPSVRGYLVLMYDRSKL